MPKITVQKDGTTVSEKRTVNFVPGTGITITATDDGTKTNIQFDSTGGAPTTADYLVGTANGSLSAEIVVGATPGGELGGTWASPTVDATHAGTTHAATQAAAEATAAGALATHEADTTSIHGIANTALLLPVDDATSNPLSVGTTADGTEASAARKDHVHATGAGTPSTQAFSDAAAVGTGPAASMTDHKHAMPALPGAGYPVDVAAAEADGTAVTPARSDHVHAHGSGYLPDAHHNQAHTFADHTDQTRTFWVPANVMNVVGPAAGGAIGAAPDYIRTMDLDAGTTEYVRFTSFVPDDWVSGMTASIIWAPIAPGAGAETVRWQITYKYLADAASAGAAGTTVAFTGNSATRAAGDIEVETAQTIATGAAANTMLRVVVARVGADAGDTLTLDAGLLGVLFSYTGHQ